MRGILELLRPGSLLLQQSIGSHKRVLEILSTLLAESLAPIQAPVLQELLTARERLGSTGLGQGVAIPHCRVPDSPGSAAAILTLAEGVDFSAADGRPVDVFVALVVPEDAEDAHLQHLKELAGILDSPKRLAALRDCRRPETLLDTLARP